MAFEDAGFTSPDEIFESINTGEIACTENRARVAREARRCCPHVKSKTV